MSERRRPPEEEEREAPEERGILEIFDEADEPLSRDDQRQDQRQPDD